MNIFKNSIIYKIWTLICKAYTHSNYHKLGLFFHNVSVNSISIKKINNMFRKEDSSNFAIMTLAIISFIATPFRWLSTQANSSINKRLFVSFKKQVNNNLIYTILLVLTASTFGINLMYFLKGENSIWLMTLFIFSIILFIVYQKIEKYIPHSLSSRFFTTIFHLGEES
ncbi:MAG: hypothetical protein KAG94_03675 [Clostridiales bacterium]|nr:hypothetical protein [Clostridiales bacterium]